MTTNTVEPRFYPFPRPAGEPLSQPDEYRELRGAAPVSRVRIWDGTDPWLITSYEDCKQVLLDTDAFSSDPRYPGWPERSAAMLAVLAQTHVMRTMDPPEHQVHKAMIQRDLSRLAVNKTRPTIVDYANTLIDALELKGRGDLVAEYARFIPGMVISELLGVPQEDREFFADNATRLLSGTAGADAAREAAAALDEYVLKLIDIKRAEPTDDLMSRLVNVQLANGDLNEEEVLAYAKMLLAGGFESTANAIVLAVMALLRFPEQLNDLTSHWADKAFVGNAINELLRYTSPSQPGQRRVCRLDRTVGGQQIKAGEGVIVATASGNYDENFYPNPDVLDLRRENAAAHLGFGWGVHQCIGSLLARAEMEVALEVLFTRLPGLRIDAEVSGLPVGSPSDVTFGVLNVPVAW